MKLYQTRLFLRIISKGREVYFLKILTLAIAFGCSALILSFSLNEFGYDRFHRDHKSIFRILQRNNADSYYGNRLSSKIPQSITSKINSTEGSPFILSRTKLMKDIHVKVGNQTFHNLSSLPIQVFASAQSKSPGSVT